MDEDAKKNCGGLSGAAHRPAESLARTEPNRIFMAERDAGRRMAAK